MEEIWKPVTGFENFYEISNKGRIKSLRRKVNIWNGQRTLEERILAAATSPLGYKRICLRNGKNKRRVFLHRLVAYEFIPNTDNKPQIDHIDGNASAQQPTATAQPQAQPAQPQYGAAAVTASEKNDDLPF